MSEFAPICIYLVISPLVSLILLGLPSLLFRLAYIFLRVFLFFRGILIVLYSLFNMYNLMFSPLVFNVLPIESSLLEFYLSQPYQDPEWV